MICEIGKFAWNKLTVVEKTSGPITGSKSYPVKIIDSFYGWLDGYQQEV